jgi:hypothetical protein
MLYKLNYNFENNDNLSAIEFNQIDQRTYFTLQIKCDKINSHRIFCFLCNLMLMNIIILIKSVKNAEIF